MLSKLTIIATVVCVSARTSWKDLSSYTFEQYVAEFDYNWTPNSSEWAAKKEIFDKELTRIQLHNSENKSWKEGVNKLTVLSKLEKQALKGRSKGANQKHQPKFLKSANFAMKPVKDLPTSVDWRNQNIVSPVKDQGYCGSCWAFASTAVIESAVAKESGLLFDLSVQQIAMCSPNPQSCGGTGGCQGATAEIAFDYVAKSAGLYQEYQYPYLSYTGKDAECNAALGGRPKATISGFVQLPENNYTALMNAIATVGPIAVSVDASWSGYESGIWTQTPPQPDIDHAVTLVGYGEESGQKYWLIRNSWSPSWGEKGYIRIARSDDDENNCAMDMTPQDGTACAGDTTPVKVCGTSGVLYDSAYPIGARAL